MGDTERQDGGKSGEDELGPTAELSGKLIGPGSRIGQFMIERELGRGGMGVVYFARDTKLDRPVAIKSLPAEVMGNPKVRSRFAREARVLASLNHPNIGTIYEQLEKAEGVGYLVLEYVPGLTLAERIAGARLKLEEALSIAQQIAEAVAAAHEQGVIHRDLKPANIKITPEGKVKVLDFGLAKAAGGEALHQQSTITTQPGWVVGTPAYMSPEQARGKPVDKRTDIWAFGCCLYEALTGKMPFTRETASDVLAGILEHDPDWEALPQGTPANIQVLLRRCLEKDPRRRLRDIGDAAIEISETLSLLASAPLVAAPSSVSLKSEIAGRPKSQTVAMIMGAAIIVVLCCVALWFVLKKQPQPSSKEIRVAVLPFENMGPAEDEYFADGITDAITARLAGIHGLAVISRQIAMQYKKSEKTAREIGKELSVDYILEGTVQRERPSDPTSRVRIIPQLIKASDDTHVWSDIYDNDMSEVFRVQSDVAEQVAQALDIRLLEPERRALQSRPTENVQAYEYYLRGNEYLRIGSRTELENDFSIAIRMYQKAVKLDPTFALAYAQLSRAHVSMYWWYHDRSEERLPMAKEAVDKAFQLDPNLPEVRLALGHYYYHGHLDYDRALEQFAIARKSQPNSDLLSFIGYVQRRQGKFEPAVANLKKASELDPLYSKLARDVGETFVLLRKYPEAERYLGRAISLSPDSAPPYDNKARLYLLAEGSTEKARAVLNQASENIRVKEADRILLCWILVELFDGKYGRKSRFTLNWSDYGVVGLFDVALPHGIPALGFQEGAQRQDVLSCWPTPTHAGTAKAVLHDRLTC